MELKLNPYLLILSVFVGFMSTYITQDIYDLLIVALIWGVIISLLETYVLNKDEISD